jgi:hypothetical protein
MTDLEMEEYLSRYISKMKMSGISIELSCTKNSKGEYVIMIDSLKSTNSNTDFKISLKSLNNGKVVLPKDIFKLNLIEVNEVDYTIQSTAFIENIFNYQSDYLSKQLNIEKILELDAVVKSMIQVYGEAKDQYKCMDRYRKIQLILDWLKIKTMSNLRMQMRESIKDPSNSKVTFVIELKELNNISDNLKGLQASLLSKTQSENFYAKVGKYLTDILSLLTKSIGTGYDIFTDSATCIDSITPLTPLIKQYCPNYTESESKLLTKVLEQSRKLKNFIIKS